MLLGAMTAGLDVLRCECGAPDCLAAQRPRSTNVVIHVLAEQSAMNGDSQAPGYLPRFGPVPSTLLRDLAGVAKTKPLSLPKARREAGYHPSVALAEFIRFRDLTCRFPSVISPPRSAISTTPCRFRSVPHIRRTSSSFAATTTELPKYTLKQFRQAAVCPGG